MSFIKQYLFLVLSLLIVLSPTWAMDSDAIDSYTFRCKAKKKFRDISQQILPDDTKVYYYQDLKDIFWDALYPKAQQVFQRFFSIMFHPDFKKPPHDNEIIVNGYRCLYQKIAYARLLRDEKGISLNLGEFYQERSLNELFALPGHKNEILRLDPSAGKEIVAFPCDSCVKSAIAEYEVPNK